MSIIVSKTLRINAVFLPETLFAHTHTQTFSHSPDGGKINIAMSVKGQMYDILDYFDLIMTQFGVGLLSAW